MKINPDQIADSLVQQISQCIMPHLFDALNATLSAEEETIDLDVEAALIKAILSRG